MLTFLLGVTRMDKIRNEYITGATLSALKAKLEERLRRFRHEQRRDGGMEWRCQTGGKVEDHREDTWM